VRSTATVSVLVITSPGPHSLLIPHRRRAKPEAPRRCGAYHLDVDIYLQTERLVLRRLTPQDIDDLFDLNNDPAVMRYLNGGKPASREAIVKESLPRWMAWYRHGPEFGWWAAQERVTGEFLGWFTMHPAGTPPEPGADPTGPESESESEVKLDEVEIGYRLRRSAWGKGYATEGTRALIRKAFTELGVRRVFANTMTVNTGSRGVMEKSGLRYLRTFHEEWEDVIEGGELGDVEYELLRDDWERQNRTRPNRDRPQPARSGPPSGDVRPGHQRRP
jgi:RimJ/RimL family protein N-acetyltransferase